jgi:hypothetical protein
LKDFGQLQYFVVQLVRDTDLQVRAINQEARDNSLVVRAINQADKDNNLVVREDSLQTQNQERI